MTKAKPILFKTEMIRAILAGNKTQTRRIVKPQDPLDDFVTLPPLGIRSRYVVGDLLWVRETWAPADDLVNGYELDDADFVAYRADGMVRSSAHKFNTDKGWNVDRIKWKPSIFMPRWASRITLRVTDVRVERLQDITEGAAIAEGVERCGGFMSTSGCWTNYAADGPSLGAARESYRTLWESINGAGSWGANPWAWAITFERVTEGSEGR